MDEAELREQVREGQEALKLMDNAQFSMAVTAIKASLIETFEYTQFKDRDDREEIWRKLQSLNAITDQLQYVIDTGRMAEKTLLEKIKDIVS